MSSSSDALRSTSDALLRDLEVLGTLEEEKRTIAPGDPRLVDLASQIADIAQRVLARTVRQRHLSQTVSAEALAGDRAMPSIDATPRHPSEVLAEWRDAERRLVAADPDSAEWTEADALVEHLREEYWRASQAPAKP
jgi:hypothetical protein